MLTEAQQINELSAQIAECFRRAGCSPSVILTGQIKYTEIPWQCPPLDSDEVLIDAPLGSYTYACRPVNSDLFYHAWVAGLQKLRQQPHRAITETGWQVFNGFMPASTGQRELWFSRPSGFPASEDEAGLVFSIECASFLKATSEITEFFSDDSNYWVRTPGGEIIGVVDGCPAHNAGWDQDYSGTVGIYANAPRGEVTTECRYDALARIRSFVEENFGLFPNYTALVQAIQMLYYLTRHKPSTRLNTAILAMQSSEDKARRRLVLWGDAISCMQQWGMTDRQKILALHNTLVPEAMTPSEFSKHIHKTGDTVPAVLSVKKEQKILDYLREQQEKDHARCHKHASVRW